MNWFQRRRLGRLVRCKLKGHRLSRREILSNFKAIEKFDSTLPVFVSCRRCGQIVVCSVSRVPKGE